ncbi:MAG: hypothetical protein M1814_006848 [Vezdaea aestivalis]|nr:MAG: hypothetical protein M1814_006848 [Vezdaea aestivalis]
MPPKAGSKRKAATSAGSPPSKKKSTAKQNGEYHPNADNSAEYGIVLRDFYPPEMANQRCKDYIDNKIPRPGAQLKAALKSTELDRAKIKVKDAVIHWFKGDLRMQDNKALSLAAEKASEAKVPLVCMYLISPQDFEAHLTAPVRVDFILRCLESLKTDLASLDIPLHVETVEKRRDLPEKLTELAFEWGANHIFCNTEYEVDELRRETKLVDACLEKGIDFSVHPDTCVVAPGELASGTGNQYAVYTPWYRAWMAHIHDRPKVLNLFDTPGKNPSTARKKYKYIFDGRVPSAPANKQLSAEEKKRFDSLWPAGEKEARLRLEKFLEKKAKAYHDQRNIPSEDGTAVVSLHFAAGTLSARTAVHRAQEKNGTKSLNGGSKGFQVWISEVAWRDFYKHVLCHWPFVCMNKPFKAEYSNIEWSYDKEQFEAWCNGKTGFPIVDAAMRQLNTTGWMHNRCRMIVASFLAKDLLIDWRMGERYFMEHLVDGDFASNNGGWGFSASTGVDPQPYFRIFNPLLQSEKFDPEGVYIRKWVPELKDVKGKPIHEPYARGAGSKIKGGYPKPCVVHKESRDTTLAAYKKGLGRDTA